MAHVVPRLPADLGTQALFSTYYLALVNDYDPVKSGMTAFETAEMNAALALVPRSTVTKLFAVQSGNWNTAANWYPSGVPGAAAKVCIPEGCVCTYNLSAPSTELYTVRVDGTLKTDPTINTAMLFDTMVVTPLGLFQDGTRDSRVASGVTHEWIIAASNGLIDVAFDTFMQSRGIIWIGETEIWGQAKTPYLEVASHTGPVATDTTLALASTPTGWAVGDEIIITATTWAVELLQTEKRTLTSSSGVNLGWTGGLTYSHAGPQGSVSRTDLKAFVANLTRNIVFRPDDANAPIHHRGHLMQMHNPANVQMHDFEVRDLGRTAKHGGRFAKIFQSNSTQTGGVPIVLTGSVYWNGSAIVLGPSYQVLATFTASGAGTMTVVGTDGLGAPQTVVVDYTTGFNFYVLSEPFFLTVTSITCSTDVGTSVSFQILARARQMNELGVRNLALASSPSTPVYTTLNNTDNLQGRYPLHLHKMGVLGEILENPPIIDGVSIHASPGWLLAQHQTHAIVKNSVGFNSPGAGFVAEDGNESGAWSNCIVAHCIGNDDGTHKEGHDLQTKDPARSGGAFHYTGRLMRVDHCVAIGSAGGHIFNPRFMEAFAGTAVLYLNPAQLDQPTSIRGVTSVEGIWTPIHHFEDNQAISCSEGLLITKTGPRQHHDVRTMLDRFKSWSTRFAFNITYTSHYTQPDLDLVEGNATGTTSGVIVSDNASDQVLIRPIVDGYTLGIDLTHAHINGPDFEIDPLDARHVIDATYRDCVTNFVNLTRYYSGGPIDPGTDEFLTANDLNGDPVTLTGLALNTGTLLITGTKHDELGDVPHPMGDDDFTIVYATLLTAFGYYVEGANKYVLADEWFSSRLTGVLNKQILPISVGHLALGSYTNNGTTDLSNNTPPAISDFSVSLTRNTNLIVDIVGRAAGNTPRFGGFQTPLKTQMVNNGDGTITLVPLADENYTETAYVWVDDVNGNTTRATMTINVNKIGLTLGTPVT